MLAGELYDPPDRAGAFAAGNPCRVIRKAAGR